MAMKYTKPFYLLLGWISVVLGVVGIIVPILPTTPFLLVAVWAFSKSSPAAAARIRNHKTFGPFIRDWQDRGVIPLRAKALALPMMAAASAYLLIWAPTPMWIGLAACAAIAAVAVYVVSRPST
jgi:uncharacterized protein